MKLKKLFALALCFVLTLSLLTVTASAEEYVPSGTGASHGSVETRKSVTKDGNNYNVHLEAWVTGKITETKGTQPMDIVLVIDQSKSMLDTMGSGTRQDAMKTAVMAFITEVAGTANAEISDHRLAIATFDDDATQVIGWTDVLTGAGTLTTTVNRLSVTNASPSTTNIAAGMSEANTLMTTGYSYNGENKAERKKVVILLTDGVPTVNDDARFDVDSADAALNVADRMKESGISIYSIGIFGGADPTKLCGAEWAHIFNWANANTCKDIKGNKWGLYWWTGIGDYIFSSYGDVYAFDVPAGNRFLNYISSNYRTTTINLVKADYSGALGSGGIGWEITEAALTPVGSNHYLAASNVDGLKAMFSTITTSASKVDIELDETTVLQDVVTEYFDIVGTPTAYALNLSNDKRTTLTAEKNGNTVSVTGFDYSEETHFVPQTGTSGQKVVVDFVITPKSTFLGGNGVYTNDVLISGLVNKGTFVENFEPQQVNVPVQSVIPGVTDQTIYLSKTADLSALLTDVDSREGDLPDRINGTDNAYVDIIYDVKNASNEVLATYTVHAGNTPDKGLWSKYAGSAPALTDCTDYTVTCTVDGDGSGTDKEYNKIASATVTVHVLKPIVATTEQTIYLSNTAEMTGSVTGWSCDSTCTNKQRVDSAPADAPEITSWDFVKATDKTDSIVGEKLDTCTNVIAVGTLSSQTFESTSVIVHVLEPTVTGTDAHIKMGAEAPMNYTYAWNTTCCDSTIRTASGNPPAVEPIYNVTVDTKYPETCTEYTVTAKVSGTEYTNIFDAFWIHVHAPTLTGSVHNVKLGSNTELNSEDVTLGWEETCISHPGQTASIPVGNPAPAYSFAQVANRSIVTPEGCTAYTVELIEIGGVNPDDDAFTAEIIVHVETPKIVGIDKTIHRGNSVTMGAEIDSWKSCNCKGTKPTAIGNPAPTFIYSGGNEVAPVKCTDYTVGLDKIGGVDLAGTEYIDTITVHVMQPSITANDATIYYSNSIDLDGMNDLSGVMAAVQWNNCCNEVTDITGSAPNPVYTFGVDSKDTYSPVDCSNLTATWNLAGENFTDSFTVHVVKPAFTTTDTTIYRGNETTLDQRVSVATAWKCSGSFGHQVQTLNSETDLTVPIITYSYVVDGTTVLSPTTYAPTECKLVVTKPIVGNKTWPDLNAFNVHVLQPTFTVATQNIWADYTNVVDLTQYGIKPYELGWKDATAGHKTPSALPVGAPTVTSAKYAFDKGTDGQYTVGTTDETVNATKLTFKLSNEYGADYPLEGKTFTIHVNKFDLTINKAWRGAEVYKQDAIFTVSGGLGDFQVVIPKEESSVIVKGLLCGQKYTVSEDGKWTWRWNKGDNETVICGEKDFEVGGHGITIEAPVHPANAITFTNVLNTLKTKWLDFCDVVENIFTKGGSN